MLGDFDGFKLGKEKIPNWEKSTLHEAVSSYFQTFSGSFYLGFVIFVSIINYIIRLG